VRVAVAEADVVVFVVDATTGVTDLDLTIAKLLHKGKVDHVLLVANKAESREVDYGLSEFMSLGLQSPRPVSALHGSGTGDLLDEICGLLGSGTVDSDAGGKRPVHIAILGRPNAGKSSIVNRLLRDTRMVVHAEPGTTRDAIDSAMVFDGRTVVLVDTAGLRKKSKVAKGIEYYANLRALDSIRRSDVCVVVSDTAAGVGEQDIRILNQILQAHRGVLFCLNKWDLVEKDEKTFDHIVAGLRRTYAQLAHVPMLSASALTGQRMDAILRTALAVHERMGKRVPLSAFRRSAQRWVREQPHPLVGGRPVKIMGGKQVRAAFPLFHFFAANHVLAQESYERYLANRIHEEFGFEGCPLGIVFKPPAGPRSRRGGRTGAASHAEPMGVGT
jgi:GTP-binding protein